MTSQSIHIGVDVGGTFTDLTIYDSANAGVFAVKVPSNRASPDSAVLSALDKSGVDPQRVELVVHGTTVATNALLERRGARAAFVTTEGFRDVIELGRTTRLVPNTLYDPYFKRPDALVRRRDRHCVPERTRSDGATELAVDEDALEQLAQSLARKGVEAVAIGFVNSYRSDANERAAKRVFDKHFEFVTTSAQVNNEIREFERFSATAANAYVMPVMSSYARRLSDAVKQVYPAAGFYTVASHGGLLSTRTVGNEPVRTILSGPAAGIAATVHLAGTIGAPNVIAYDMGGTSTDVALVAEGSFPLRRESILEGLVLRLPQLDIHTVGAGGGSIAMIDGGGGLQLGPESAGAIPGPACYGRGGTRPAVTDADVALGLIGAGQRLGDSLQVDRQAAERALGALAAQAGVSVVEMADAVLRLAVAKMAAAIYEISVARGFDPRDFALVSYGGAGPLHAALVAEEVGIRRVIIPPAPGAFSAFGALCSALAKDRTRTLLRLCDAEAMAEADRHFAVMADELRAEFADEGAALDRIVHERQLDLRYQGQAHELTVDVPAGMPVGAIIERFESAFEREYGRRDRGRGIELVNIRLIARIPLDMPRFAPAPPGSGTPAERIIGIGGAATPCPVWKREDLPTGASWRGPLIVEEMSATTFVPAGWTLRQGAFGELNLECEASD